MKRVGIFSGTFDPVHLGHIEFALQAIEKSNLDKVFFLVEPSPRRKQAVKAFEHRVAMVDIALAKYPKLASIVLNHAQFSVIETLPVLRARFKDSDIYFLMGDDMLSHFTNDQWPHVEEFVSFFKLIVGSRKGTVQAAKRQIKLIEKTKGVKIRHEIFEARLPSYSSSQVRAALRSGESTGVSPEVYSYIRDNKLYSSKKLA